MKYFITITIILLSISSCMQQAKALYVIADDITNFWVAYDKIITTKDSIQQYDYLNTLFIEKGTPGLKAIMEKRGYTPTSYIEAINNYPQFWNSIRTNTQQSKAFAKEIEIEVAKLKKLYPDLKPAKIYFTVGALMTGGTTLDSLVLIGSEIALADSTVVSNELPDWLAGNLRTYFDSNPIDDVVLLNVHEYVHTQQNRYGYDLLSQSLYEGVAEFVSVKATGKPSTTPAIRFGKENDERVKKRFAKEMFSPNWNEWLYNNFDNEFKMRDLGYYVGYVICEKHYDQAADKKQAIKELIELDYGSMEAVEGLVGNTNYFSQPLKAIKQNYEDGRPEVVNIKEFKNGDQMVNPGLTQITIEFSTEMSDRFGRFDDGPLGKDAVLPITKFIGLSKDKKALSYGIQLEPNKRYQRSLSEVFRTEEGLALKPFLIDFKTANQ